MHDQIITSLTSTVQLNLTLEIQLAVEQITVYLLTLSNLASHFQYTFQLDHH